MVGVWLVELASFSILYGKVPRLIVKKTIRLTQAVAFFESIFCAELCCVIVHRQSVKVYLHMYSGNVQENPSCVGSCHNESSRLSPVLAYDFLLRCKFSTPTSTSLYSSINRLYAQNPGFEIIREESVKVYLHMHNGNVQQNPICVESCVTKECSISPRPDTNSVLLRAHLCTAVDSMCKKNYVRNCLREREGLHSGHVLLEHLCTAVLIGSMRRTLCSKLFLMRA